ncbi:hypothetical protein FHETE_2969 [Fusarium heterosporum]|uniref:CFEM domain-containing protein n=1 Tax=Fusarium heterosporum TaxID=42747 RepID=A0A8H5TLC6_FUSHE|nr:hypothetical protein FHETE_2969 [Fusarium heterosporum]
MRFSLSTVVALGALQTFGVYAQDCVNACIESVKPTVGCADATQAGCICVSTDFVKGVAECARAPSCNAADADITSLLSSGFCTGQAVPALPEAAATPTSNVAATSEAAAVTSETPIAAVTTDAPETTGVAATTDAAETTVAVSTPAVLPETSEAPEATATDSAETAEPTASEASASATDADASSATSEAAGAAATSDSSKEETDKDEDTHGGGMSGSAKAGVGIGVTIGILALGVAGFFFWKRHQNQGNSHRNMGGMSPPPMASRDRSYPSPDQGSIGEKHGYDLELMSHRYEDMLPREEPRHMV